MNPIYSKAAAHLAGKHAQKAGFLNLPLGFALLRDRRVPMGPKVRALAVGIAVTAICEMLEVPVEAIIAGLVPVLGLGIDIALDGLEFVALPLLIAAILMPKFAPERVRQEISAKRAG